MTKSLLVLALMATQLLSWSARPVYLCVESDGSFRIDAGPENCDCCRAEGARHDHFSDGPFSDNTDDCHDEANADHPPCDCMHIQISEQQSPVVLSRVAPPGASRVADSFAVPLCGLNPDPAALDAASRLHGLSPAIPWPQCGRLSVVLRC